MANAVPDARQSLLSTNTDNGVGSAATTVRTFYVDSRSGNDANDGLAATGSGRGPWRTLGRLAASSLAAGDTVVLGCNSEWNETLRLPVSGTATHRILVTSPPTGCALRPTIDGSTLISVKGWRRHSGNVFKATLTSTPLQLTDSVNQYAEAHHPNVGYLASEPKSPYLRAAADSGTSVVNGQSVSTSIVTGSDLVLPPGATLGAGTRARIRLYSWTIDEVPVSGMSGNRINLGIPTTYPLGAGWGYFLLGQQWMADSHGEWFYDAPGNALYVYFREGSTRDLAVRATVLPTGIDLKNATNVMIDGLAVRRVGLGADLRGSTGIILRNTTFDDIAGMGADVTASTSALIETSVFTRTGTDAISGWRHHTGPSAGLVVRNNVVRDSGVLLQGDEVRSVPNLSLAAIYGGPGSVISGNVVTNTGYIGIQVMAGGLVESNHVYGACSVLDDCAGIYTQTSANSVIRGNTIEHSRGALHGKAPSMAYSQAQGIYLDESASNALIEDNTVIDTDNGIQVHVSSHNIVRNNRLYGNRRAQIWMQSTRNTQQPGGDLVNNTVTGNVIAPITPTSVGIWLDTAFTSTQMFGHIDGNRFYDGISPIAVRESRSSGSRDFSFAQWQRSTDSTLPTGRDAGGGATSATGLASFRISGASVVPNGNLAADATGWTSRNLITPPGILVREACPAGFCLRYTAGAPWGVATTPHFSVRAGQWYRLSIDLAADQDARMVNIFLRRGGGGSNGYDALSDRNISFPAGRSWQRYTMVFQATTTVNVADILTGDRGARIDVEPVATGTTLSLANLELVPITPDATTPITAVLANPADQSRPWSCPFIDAQAVLCSKLRRLGDDAWLGWPHTVPARRSDILYAQEPSLLDSDGDGIPNPSDQCAATPSGTAVNAAGCPLVTR